MHTHAVGAAVGAAVSPGGAVVKPAAGAGVVVGAAHIPAAPGIGLAGGLHTSPGAHWLRSDGCSGSLHRSPTCAYAAHAPDRHHCPVGHGAPPPHGPGDPDVVDAEVVPGVDVVEFATHVLGASAIIGSAHAPTHAQVSPVSHRPRSPIMVNPHACPAVRYGTHIGAIPPPVVESRITHWLPGAHCRPVHVEGTVVVGTVGRVLSGLAEQLAKLCVVGFDPATIV